jgi:hypothetical protein
MRAMDVGGSVGLYKRQTQYYGWLIQWFAGSWDVKATLETLLYAIRQFSSVQCRNLPSSVQPTLSRPCPLLKLRRCQMKNVVIYGLPARLSNSIRGIL